MELLSSFCTVFYHEEKVLFCSWKIWLVCFNASSQEWQVICGQENRRNEYNALLTLKEKAVVVDSYEKGAKVKELADVARYYGNPRHMRTDVLLSRPWLPAQLRV